MHDACVSDEMWDLIGHIVSGSASAAPQTSIQIALKNWRSCLEKNRTNKNLRRSPSHAALPQKKQNRTKQSRDHFQNVPETTLFC